MSLELFMQAVSTASRPVCLFIAEKHLPVTVLKYLDLAAHFDAPEYPKDLRERARVDSLMDWFNTGFHQDFGHELVYPQILPNHKRPTDEQKAATIAWGKVNQVLPGFAQSMAGQSFEKL